MLHIEHARHLGGRRFELHFSDGRSGIADLEPLVAEGPGRVFEPLRDEGFVARFELHYGTLTWPGDLGVAPEYLYFLTLRDDPALREQFEHWGYLPQTPRV
jgi:hypothetical protein